MKLPKIFLGNPAPPPPQDPYFQGIHFPTLSLRKFTEPGNLFRLKRTGFVRLAHDPRGPANVVTDRQIDGQI